MFVSHIFLGSSLDAVEEVDALVTILLTRGIETRAGERAVSGDEGTRQKAAAGCCR